MWLWTSVTRNVVLLKHFFLNISNNFSLLCRPCIDNTKNPLKTNIKVHKTTVFILTIEKNNFCIDAKIGRKHNWVANGRT